MSRPPPEPSAQPFSAPPSSRVSNGVVLAALALCLLVGLLIRPDEGDGGTILTLFGLPLPSVCWFRFSTGIPCAGCGLTRSVVLLLHGRVGASLAIHPFGVVAVALALLLAPPRLARALGRTDPWIIRWDRSWGLAVALATVLMLIWWVSRVGVGVWLRTWLP
jgi:hypothetical protein